MKLLATVVVTVNLAYIGLLPRLFFRKDGRRGAMWWLTAAPFMMSAAGVVAGLCAPGHQNALWQDAASAVLGALSILLISAARRAHAVPIALWHQQDDRPQSIVTWGPYRHVRHPFYAAFLLALTAALFHAPHVLTMAALASGYVLLDATAAREEGRLCASQFGAIYRAYIRGTGRFFPRWSRHDA